MFYTSSLPNLDFIENRVNIKFWSNLVHFGPQSISFQFDHFGIFSPISFISVYLVYFSLLRSISIDIGSFSPLQFISFILVQFDQLRTNQIHLGPFGLHVPFGLLWSFKIRIKKRNLQNLNKPKTLSGFVSDQFLGPTMRKLMGYHLGFTSITLNHCGPHETPSPVLLLLVQLIQPLTLSSWSITSGTGLIVSHQINQVYSARWCYITEWIGGPLIRHCWYDVLEY